MWNHAVFSKNRDRLLSSDVAQRFFAEVNKQAKKFISDEHFTVDGRLIHAWASQKSFRSKDGSDDGDGPRREEPVAWFADRVRADLAPALGSP